MRAAICGLTFSQLITVGLSHPVAADVIVAGVEDVGHGVVDEGFD